ncbi:MAG: hypothetical protein ACOH2F_07115 [Cellulomonas sp.]
MSDVTVQGGAGGIHANHADMRTTSGILAGVGVDLVGWSVSVGAIAADDDLVSSLVLSPVTGAVAKVQLLEATTRLVVASVQVNATGFFLSAAVDAYEAVDAALAALAELQADVTGFTVGFLAVPLAVGGVAVAAVVGVVAVPVAVVLSATKGAVTESVDWLLTGDPVDIGAAMRTDLEAFTRSVVTPLVADLAVTLALGAPGLVTGLETGLLTGALLLPGGVVLAGALLVGGKPLPPTSYADAVGRIIGLGESVGAFQDNAFVRAGEPTAPTVQLTPHGIADVFRGQQDVGNAGEDGPDPDTMNDDAGRIRVIEVPQPDGSSAWIIQLPGTQEWSPGAGPSLADVTSDVLLMAERETQYEQAVLDVMTRAGIGSGEPVMLAGHSLGGITAANVAANDAVQQNYHVTHVVTGGSPIDRVAVPDGVQVLALQDSRDVVPRLDGYRGTDRPNWTTVTFTDNQPTTQYLQPGDAHDYLRYIEGGRAVDVSTDPSVQAFSASAEPFFLQTDTATVLDYQYKRVVP